MTLLNEEKAGLLIEELIKRDPSVSDVVAAMRSQRRTNIKIATCLRKAMLELGMDLH